MWYYYAKSFAIGYQAVIIPASDLVDTSAACCTPAFVLLLKIKTNLNSLPLWNLLKRFLKD